jgi:hypothetical protein
MQFFVQPSLQSELMNIIQLGEKMMELHTGLPMIVLGMQGNFEETAKGRTIANNNGSSVLRRIARNFDGSITEPHIRRYYAWMMIYLEDDSLKGDFNIKACGSAALVERDLQNQQLPNIVTMAAQIPALEWDVAMAGDEFLKSQRFDPKMFKLSDKRKQELIAQAKPPVFPQIEAAKIREEGATQREQLKLQDKAAEREHESTENALERMVEQMKIKIDGELGAAELSAEQQLSLNGIKADLAGLTMKLNTQKQLSGMNGGQASTPPTEPAGRAQPGMSYQQ